MAHVTEVRIDGLMGRTEPVHLQLNRGVNIFFGENGCGKTTLLKILDAALSRDGEVMERLPVERAAVDIFSINEERVIKHVWERRDARRATAHDQQQEIVGNDYVETVDGRLVIMRTRSTTEWKLTPRRSDPSERGKRWQHTFLPTTRLYFGDGPPGRPIVGKSRYSEQELDQAFSESVNKAWLQFYSQTLNEVRTIQESGLRTVLRQVLSPVSERAPVRKVDSSTVYQRVATFLARHSDADRTSLGSEDAFKKRYEKDPDLRQIVDNLDNIERQIERAMIQVDSFLTTISSLLSRGKSLTLSDNLLQVLLADGRSLPIAGLSSGEKHLIKILLASMTAGPNSVLIDEPELSMHIDWQRIFVKTILSLNPNSQLILATHSPEVMADMDDSWIFKL